jgi:glucosyl-3-phosphoglycerate synthase
MNDDAALRWARTRSYRHADFGRDAPTWRSRPTVSVCLPARDESATIGPIVTELVALRELGLIDEVVVIDAASHDSTAALAARAGAVVFDQHELRPEFGVVLGKGDAMWRALSVLEGEIVCFLDSDTQAFGGHFALGLIGPLVSDPELEFVKGAYRRPFKAGGVEMPDGGGRVNELMARPLLTRFYPELAAVRQPLAGEFASRRELLERLPFFTGYGVEIGLLIDAYRVAGLDGLAQVDLGVRQNRHQPLRELGPMAYAVLGAVTRRLEEEGRLRSPRPEFFLTNDAVGAEVRDTELIERPPAVSLTAPAPARAAAPRGGIDLAPPVESR